MALRSVLLPVLLLLATGLPALDQAHTLKYGGLTRTYKVHTPPSYDGTTPFPVVLVLHGGGGSADNMIRWIRMDDTADEAGFVTVYPNGFPAAEGRYVWNSGTCCEPAISSKADDVGFIAAMLDDLAERYAIDTRRICATGVSNGAMMSYTLASELSNRIAAIAPVAAAMGFDEIKATRPVPVLHIHGTEDLNAPIEGGVGPNSLAGFPHIPLRDSIARWVKLNGCPSEPVVTELPDIQDDGTRVRREVYGPGPGGAEVILYVIEGGGHTWPGRPDLAEWYLYRTEVGGIEPDPRLVEVLRRAGRASRDISANDIIWEFFSRHSLAEEPRATGPAATFHVGYRILDLPYTWGDRDVTLTTNLWYPTDTEPATHTYSAGRGERDTLLAVDAPVSGRRRPYPVVFFAHGGFGCGLNSAFLMEHLAAHGYIGVGIDYVDYQPPDYTRQVYSCRTRGDQALERHRNREIKLSTGLPDLAEDLLQYIRIFTHEPRAALPWIVEGRAKPTSHVLDRLLAMDTDPESFLYGTIDDERIAISGHSAGGITLESLIGGLPEYTDGRFKAAVIFSAPLFPLYEENIPSVRIPIMVWAGDNDPAAINPKQSPTARRDVYDLVTTPKYFLIVKDSDHFTFGNPRPIEGSRSLQDAVASSTVSQLIASYSKAFLDRYLLDDPDADEVLARNDPRLRYYVREETPGHPVAFGTEVFAEVAIEPTRDGTNYLSFDGLDRSYYIHTPPSYDGKTALPVVLILHGGGGDGASTARTTGMNEKADEAGFIAVYPNGYPAGGGRHSWNAGTCCEPAVSRDADDVGFINAVLDDLGRLYSVDLSRVYATGISNGAMMSYLLASKLSGRIAAIAPVAAAMGFEEIQSARPVPVLHIHGSEDRNAPPAGGVGPNSLAGIVHVPLQDCIQRWVEFNGCSPTPVVSQLPDSVEDGTTVRRERYESCRDGAEVTLYLVQGGGHTWPGMPYENFAEYYLERCRLRNVEPNPTALEYYRQAGRASRDISANDVIWEFFRPHSLKE